MGAVEDTMALRKHWEPVLKPQVVCIVLREEQSGEPPIMAEMAAVSRLPSPVRSDHCIARILVLCQFPRITGSLIHDNSIPLNRTRAPPIIPKVTMSGYATHDTTRWRSSYRKNVRNSSCDRIGFR